MARPALSTGWVKPRHLELMDYVAELDRLIKQINGSEEVSPRKVYEAVRKWLKEHRGELDHHKLAAIAVALTRLVDIYVGNSWLWPDAVALTVNDADEELVIDVYNNNLRLYVYLSSSGLAAKIEPAIICEGSEVYCSQR